MAKQSPLATLPPITGAAVVTSVVMYPADVIRALCMANPGTSPFFQLRNFLGTHGPMGFVQQGLVPEVTRASFSRVIKFWLQPIAHQSLFDKAQAQGTPVTKGLAGAFSTIPEVLTISPLENVKLAEQLDSEKRFNGSASVVRHLLKTRGFFGGLYIGYAGMQIRQMLWTGGFFLSLDVATQQAQHITSSRMGQDILGGFFAGVFGTCINCWTDVVRSVIQKKAVAATFDASIPAPSALTHLNPVPFFQEAGALYASQGLGGLYAGFPVKCLHLGGSGALLAVLVPRFKEWYSTK